MAGQVTGPTAPTQATGAVGSGTGPMREHARETMDAARDEAGELAGRAARRGKSLLAHQKDVAADRIESVAHALHGSVRTLHDEDAETTGHYVDLAAQRRAPHTVPADRWRDGDAYGDLRSGRPATATGADSAAATRAGPAGAGGSTDTQGGTHVR
jgi:hypothetical protein